jgi:hypothetical protein
MTASSAKPRFSKRSTLVLSDERELAVTIDSSASVGAAMAHRRPAPPQHPPLEPGPPTLFAPRIVVSPAGPKVPLGDAALAGGATGVLLVLASSHEPAGYQWKSGALGARCGDFDRDRVSLAGVGRRR